MTRTTERILIVDDEPNIVEVIRLYVEHVGYEPVVLYSGKDVIEAVEREQPDLAVLDVMLPDTDGFELCRRIRALPEPLNDTPIMMLTAKGESIDKLRGFNLGVDDYIVKPFDPNELVARMKAILRRVRAAKPKEQEEKGPERKLLEFPDLSIDIDQYRVFVDGVRVDLTPKEMELLYFMASNPGRVYTRDELLEQVWKFDFAGGTRTVDAHVKNIRKKLGSHEGWSVQTLWGIGYSFEVKA
ncbi:response regulator transcription factor [Gorillibacterium sp. sgz5001074]|uniref:response regulator transcription factor n=1 Tax=Gorillibacterium sp. sgz5001074 TaxID=3446695 RepID=UPI003F666D11